jgi:dipeptidyl aminopeptidase/acylaminoacyl peptidase
MAQANSPHNYASQIGTPMLVIHGDKDYRVPIAEALRLWHQLLSESRLPAAEDGTGACISSENHWVLTPQHRQDLVPGGDRIPELSRPG